ncbi:hypothetical protein [Nocardia callitridis]|uniref:Uncharacterized protein n=1 Tax=Nocardia callitridis TaxID=648753 RepID=A0ABP9K084_9NOCA
MAKHDDEPILDLVSHDTGISRHLSKALKVLVDSPGIDKNLQKQLREIMNGQGSLRDLAGSESFTRLSEAAMSKLAAQTPKSREEMQRLAQAGEQVLDTYRNEVSSVSPPLADGTEAAPSSSYPAPATTHAAPPPIPADRADYGVIPGTRKPNRERIVTSEELDEDDLYYRDRRQKGWLE